MKFSREIDQTNKSPSPRGRTIKGDNLAILFNSQTGLVYFFFFFFDLFSLYASRLDKQFIV